MAVFGKEPGRDWRAPRVPLPQSISGSNQAAVDPGTPSGEISCLADHGDQPLPAKQSAARGNAQGFDMVYAFGTNSTNDALDDIALIRGGVGNDLIRSYGRYPTWNVDNQAYIRYHGSSSWQIQAKGFKDTTFDMSTGGVDQVLPIYDSVNNDTFTGDADWAEMTDDLASYRFRIQGLGSTDSVQINRITGQGADRDAHLATIAYLFSRVGDWLP